MGGYPCSAGRARVRGMRSRSIITRVLAAVVALASAFTVVLVYNASQQRRLVAELAAINDGWVPVLRQLDAVQVDLRSFARVVSNGDAIVLRPSLRASLTLFPLPDRIDQRCESLNATLRTIGVGPLPDDDERFVDNVRRTVEQVRGEVAADADAAAELLLEISTEPPVVEPARSELLASITSTEERIDDLSRLVERRVDEAVAGVREREQRSLQRVALASSLALALALGIGWSIRRALQPIRALTRETERLTRGDYRPPNVEAGNDEVGALAREFTHMVAAVRDRDARLRRQNDALEDAYQQLVIAQRAQVQAERLAAIGEISSQITHELRNPLSSIGLNVEMLAEELPPEAADARDMLTAVERELTRLTALTERYLSMARGDGRARVPCDLFEIAHDVTRQLRPGFERDGTDLLLAGESAVVHADADQMRQVLINILQNALAAVRDDVSAHCVHVRVQAEHERVIVWIDDDGPGVPQAQRARLFEPFTSGRADGTGLGLAICRRIVTDHGGTIGVQRSPELGGARFTLTFAAIEEPNDAATNGPHVPRSERSAG